MQGQDDGTRRPGDRDVYGGADVDPGEVTAGQEEEASTAESMGRQRARVVEGTSYQEEEE